MNSLAFPYWVLYFTLFTLPWTIISLELAALNTSEKPFSLALEHQFHPYFLKKLVCSTWRFNLKRNEKTKKNLTILLLQIISLFSRKQKSQLWSRGSARECEQVCGADATFACVPDFIPALLLRTVTARINLVPRAFPLKNGWGGKRPWHRLVTCTA